MNCQAVLMCQYFLMFDKFVSHFFRFFIILIQDFFEFVLSSKECQYLKHLRNNNLISLITFYWLDKSPCFNAKYATIINEFTLSIQGNFMHLTVTPWRSLFPMAQKSEVSDIAAPVPLETGKKKSAVCMQTHVSLSSISILYHMLCSYNTISQGSHNIWTQGKPEEIQFKLQ